MVGDAAVSCVAARSADDAKLDGVTDRILVILSTPGEVTGLDQSGADIR